MKNTKINIYILCGNAAFNKGDRGNLDTQIKILRSAYPEAEITYDSYRSEVDRNWYNAKVLPRGWLLSFAQIKGIRKADIVVWGGGALICDNSFRALIPMWLVIIGFIRLVLRKPIAAWAHGVILDTRFGRFFAKFVYQLVDIIAVRDQNSYAAIKSLGKLNAPVILTADPAILLEPKSAETGRMLLSELGLQVGGAKKIIAISPTYWPFYHRSSDFFPLMLKAKFGFKSPSHPKLNVFNIALETLVVRLVNEYDAQVLLLPRYSSQPWKDLEYLKKIRDNCQMNQRVFVYDQDIYSPEAYTSMYYHFDMLVSTALHDLIFATALDRPCVNLFYEPKGRDFFKALGSDDRMMDWNCLFESDGTERVLAKVRYTFENWEILRPAIVEKKKLIQAAAKRNLECVDEVLTRKSTRKLPTTSWVSIP